MYTLAAVKLISLFTLWKYTSTPSWWNNMFSVYAFRWSHFACVIKILFLCTELSLLIQWFQTFNNSFLWVDKSLMLPLSLEVPVPLPRVWIFCPSLRGAKVLYILFSLGSFSEFVEPFTSMFLFCFVLTRAGPVESVWLNQTLILQLIVWLCM